MKFHFIKHFQLRGNIINNQALTSWVDFFSPYAYLQNDCFISYKNHLSLDIPKIYLTDSEWVKVIVNVYIILRINPTFMKMSIYLLKAKLHCLFSHFGLQQCLYIGSLMLNDSQILLLLPFKSTEKCSSNIISRL